MSADLWVILLTGCLLMSEESILNNFALAAKPEDHCTTCKYVVNKFNEGILKTSKGNFGGGNTHWEEKKLGSFAHSETRLLEIMETLCPDSGSESKSCHHMVERTEDMIEAWWFQHFAKGLQTDLNQFLCVENINACCPNGTYGPKCSECQGGRASPCNGNGRCIGDGTRDGTGKCTCDPGYTDSLCNRCGDGYYQDNTDKESIVCSKCHLSCKSTCTGAGPANCHDCATGWSRTPEGCKDDNECDDEVCEDNEFCTNTEGSYQCTRCHVACVSCTGPTQSECTVCANRHFLNGTTCLPCHISCYTTCSDTTPAGCSSCDYGWKWIDGECRDVNECVDGTGTCASDEYCINSLGSFKCSTCHSSCAVCTGPGNDGCTVCKTGYALDGEKRCVDVDECSINSKSSDLEKLPKCSEPHARCINTHGSYRCDCESGYQLNEKDECVIPSQDFRPKAKPDATNSKNSKSKASTSSKKKKRNKVESKMHALDILQYTAVLATFVLAEVILRSRFWMQCVVLVIFSAYFYWYIGYLEHSFLQK